MGNALFGMYREEDEAHVATHKATQQARQNQVIERERERRVAARKKAETDLAEARKRENALHDEIMKTVRDLSLSEDRLITAKSNLAKASADLKRLSDQQLELVSRFIGQQILKCSPNAGGCS
jgi:hypothetical protein